MEDAHQFARERTILFGTARGFDDDPPDVAGPGSIPVSASLEASTICDTVPI